jgi:hypothetical protein
MNIVKALEYKLAHPKAIFKNEQGKELKFKYMNDVFTVNQILQNWIFYPEIKTKEKEDES